MRVDPAGQLRLLDVQELDTKLDQLAHRQRTVPQIAELAGLDQQAAALRDREVAVRTQVSDLERELAKAESDVEQVRTRIARDQQLLDTGSVASARQLEDLQREVASLGKRVSDLEDAELDVMERLEDAQTRLAAVSAEGGQLATSITAATTARDAALADIGLEADRVRTERDRVVTEVPAELVTLYERIRRESGTGAAALHRGRCQGCQITVPPGDLAAIRSAAPDEVLRCEECRRILVRTAESGL